jgi:hypothetical protein
VISFVCGLASAAPLGGVAAEEPLRPPLVEIDHPRYADATGRPVRWGEVKALARDSDAIGRVRRRRLGRTVLRVTFTGAAAVEVWGTARLASDDSWVALPLAVQTAATSVCAVLLWTNLPSAVVEDRSIVLAGANGVLGGRR